MPWAARLHHAIQKRLLWVLLAAYGLSAVAPAPGLAMRAASFGRLAVGGVSLDLSVPALLLGILLFNSSLNLSAPAVRTLLGQPRLVIWGLIANTLLPLAFALLASWSLTAWHNSDEIQNLLVALAIVGSMPIAGSSTAWAQNAEGNVALSMGLIMGSTLTAPLTTPLVLHSVAAVTTGDYAEDLAELAAGQTQLFLLVTIVAPTILGLLVRRGVGAARVARAAPGVKLTNQAVLIALNYSNAALALPQVFASPDADYLALVGAVASALCATAFVAGWQLGRPLRAQPPERVSLLFGLGMNNNGSGLVLASSALADHHRVLLCIVVYNLVQQIAAGVADRFVARRLAQPG